MKSRPKSLSLHPVRNRGWWDTTCMQVWHGKPPEPTDGKPVTGRLNQKTRYLVTRLVNTLLSNCTKFKIGVTGDIDVRRDQADYRGNYQHIGVLYQTTSQENAKALEVELINKYKKWRTREIDNQTARRARDLTTYSRYYFVYVVFSNRA